MIYEQHNIKIHSILFIFTLILSFLFAWDYKTVDAKKIDKVETWTWLQSFTWNTTLPKTKENRKKDIWEKAQRTLSNELNASCDKTCKIKQLEKAWTNPEIATILVNECKKQDKEVVKCIKFWASILWAESSGWNNCHKFNCYWVLWMTFNSYEESTKDWVTRFGKHWFRQKNPSNFYSDSPSWKPTTRYCTSEKSSWKPYCINWHRHAWTVFNQLTF